MKLEEKVFNDFDNSLEKVIKYLQDCKKASEELRQKNTLTGIPDDFLSLSGDISDEAIDRVCQGILGKKPNKINLVTNRKTCIFI